MAFFYYTWESHFIPEIHTIPFVAGVNENGEFMWCENIDDIDSEEFIMNTIDLAIYAEVVEECFKLCRPQGSCYVEI